MSGANFVRGPRPSQYLLRVAKRWTRMAVGSLFLYTGIVPMRNALGGLLGKYSLRILLYHRVNDIAGDKDAVRTAAFEAQMRYLSDSGNVISLGSVLDLAEKGGSVNAIAITFDDGYQDNFTQAVPILERYGLPASFFVATDYVGTQKRFPWDTSSQIVHRTLTWAQLRRMEGMGFEIGAHTCSHRNLAQLLEHVAVREILDSKARLDRELGGDVRSFAIPFGKRRDISPRLSRVIQDNFDICCNNIRGGNSLSSLQRYDLHRCAVQQWWSLFDFKRELEGVFDFIEWFRR